MPSTETVFLGRRARLGKLALASSGKVRDLYALDPERLLFVTSDRVSAFDVVMPRGVPHKGRVLTAIATHWFGRTRDLVPNHLEHADVDRVAAEAGLDGELREALRGRIMVVRRARPTSVEWVVRGYLAGSGWKEYRETDSVCGIPLPAGLEPYGRLPRPILTPTTKDETHDLPLSPAEARARVGPTLYDRAERIALSLFARGAEELARAGILLADTKFEFGLAGEELLLIDEALTPDSSRFWPAAAWKPGESPPSYDKQILRDWLETLDWDKEPPGPEIPDEVVERLSARYLEICERITGALPEGVRS
jgi:phosphoribosylaminoimidazole-succinocarboxamide synthase